MESGDLGRRCGHFPGLEEALRRGVGDDPDGRVAFDFLFGQDSSPSYGGR